MPTSVLVNESTGRNCREVLRTPKDPGFLNALRIIAHDLRGPIANLSILIELMEAYSRVQAHDRLSDSARRAQDVIEALSGLLNGFLERTRQTGDPLAFKPTLLELTEVVRRVVNSNEPLAAERGIRFELEGLDALVVKGDAQLLTEAIDNIVSNASRYSPSGSVITCSVRRAGRDAVISVADAGGRLTDHELKRAMKPFAALSRPRSPAVQSFGLGLWIVRLILERHGGQLVATADRGSTRFELRLPASLI
jgi:signal transduction histidine kinase